jgi:hypothetical protein
MPVSLELFFLMNVIVWAIVVTGVILLFSALLGRSGRDTNSEALQDEVRQRVEEENRRWADERPLPSTEGKSWLTQPEPAPKMVENVTTSLTNTAVQSHCPACGAPITANDESCPSCEIAFVADGLQKWTPGTGAPADGIYRPPTEVGE